MFQDVSSFTLSLTGFLLVLIIDNFARDIGSTVHCVMCDMRWGGATLMRGFHHSSPKSVCTVAVLVSPDALWLTTTIEGIC